MRTININIIDRDGNEHFASLIVSKDDWMDELDFTVAITTAAISWASNHGISYKSWEHLY